MLIFLNRHIELFDELSIYPIEIFDEMSIHLKTAI